MQDAAAPGAVPAEGSAAAPGLRLRRTVAPRTLISLVPMIDVMLILLVFFMVTSTYLDLNMVPAVQRAEDGAPDPAPLAQDAAPASLLVRIGADGRTVLSGREMSLDDLTAEVRARLLAAPLTPILLLPSGAADMQALVTVMDRLTLAGATRLRVIRLAGAGP